MSYIHTPVILHHDDAGETRMPKRPLEKMPTQSCAAEGCQSYTRKLQLCSRCKSVRYCSKECQRGHWRNHKSWCDFVTNQIHGAAMNANIADNPFTADLRNFNSRFGNNFMMATIRALDLYQNPQNLETQSVVLWVEPRPHKEKGSRFRFRRVLIATHEEMIEMAASAGDMVRATLKQNELERAKVKRQYHGTLDYAVMMVIATNTGPNELPGDVPPAIRMRPVNIETGLVGNPELNAPSYDWIETLRYSIDNDIPSRVMPTKTR